MPVMAALPLIDDFNDGNDTGWTRFHPLGGGTYSFPSGGYQIQTAASPDPGTFGPGRAVSYRNDETITSANLSWDILGWDNSLTQIFGGLARMTNVGPGTTNAYGLVYGNGSLDLIRFENEGVGGLVASTVAITLNPANDYRFVFSLDGSNLSGKVFDLAAPAVAIATISGTDATYASGVTGFVVASSGAGTGTGNATFDNFNLSPIPEPASGLLALLGGLAFLRRRR